MKVKRVATEICAVLLILMYAYTAYNKLTGHQKFVYHFKKVHVFNQFPELAAWVIPVMEIAIIALLVSQVKKIRLWGFYMSGVLLVLFTIYLSAMKLFAPKLPCSCGGFIDKLKFTEHILLNVGLLAISTIGIVLLKEHHNLKKKETLSYTPLQGA